ncbi:flavin reductase family protein [uncultured Roseobacter sp.]|uniref:flavin reductase family protein n=1 Tax=uncultured Roseobacter sp. TaxID=114847 RepID=UPI00261F4031|nr:flavin reductase family protein [uncultured Roseobacter sp.]
MADTPLNFEPSPDDTGNLRRAFGCYATGVTVITTERPEGSLGMTANSFSSVSLDPPLVLWCPAKNSKRHNAFVEAERFSIHVLAADQLHVARHFATSGDGFSTADWAPGADGRPILRNCLAAFDCVPYAVHPAGDHSLVLGLVRKVTLNNRNAPGLLFDQGRFGSFTETTLTAQ